MPRLTIAAVVKSPVKTWQLVKSPLKEDFAVLKIDRIPEGLEPLPLDPEPEVRKIAKLSPVIALGFPLGSRTQASTVNVSVTLGHVRRTFENMFQVDTSIHRGNSGGPIIDIRGKVIGIASAVVVDWTGGPMRIATPLSDIGMVLPVTGVAALMQELKAGQIKWNGVLDLSVADKLKQISEMAKQGRWAAAQGLADKELELSLDPTLVMTAGMMHFCSGDNAGAQRLFGQALSMDVENNKARLMLYILAWLGGQPDVSPHHRELLTLDWRSPDEFLGYLVHVLDGLVEEQSALKGGYTENEKAWLHYVVGLIRAKQEDLSDSEELFKEAVLTADIDDWLPFLALARLEKVQHQKMSSLKDDTAKADYRAQMESFSRSAQQIYADKRERRNRLAPLFTVLAQASLGPEGKKSIFEQLLEHNYRRGDVLARLVFYSAMAGFWSEALEYARTFLTIEGRENADRLSVGLLVPQIHYKMGQRDKARAGLEDYHRRSGDPWYRAISKCLLTEGTEKSLTEKAGESAEDLLVTYTALGFWAEGAGDGKKAMKYYREALGSYLDYRIEYEFARERIKRVKKASDQ